MRTNRPLRIPMILKMKMTQMSTRPKQKSARIMLGSMCMRIRKTTWKCKNKGKITKECQQLPCHHPCWSARPILKFRIRINLSELQVKLQMELVQANTISASKIKITNKERCFRHMRRKCLMRLKIENLTYIVNKLSQKTEDLAK